MSLRPLHRWDISPHEAAQTQSELRRRLVLRWDGRAVKTIGGVDMSLKDGKAHAAIVVIRFPDLTPLHGVAADAPLVFPYVPGLLAFREGPAILAAWERLEPKPDLLMFDGQGIAHPRGIGIASQMGLWLERPTIGVAKSWLYGRHAEPGPRRGDSAELHDERDPALIIGAVLRSRDKGNPLYISPGHFIDVPPALDFAIRCCAGYRLPEPTRWAHKFAAGAALPSTSSDQLALL